MRSPDFINRRITYIALIMSLLSALNGLEPYPSLHNINLDKISQYSHLIACLKNDIILAQPASEVTELPEALPPIVAQFLEEGLQISGIQASWTILKRQLWCCPKVELEDEDYQIFKQFGWEKGLSKYKFHYHILQSAIELKQYEPHY